MQDNQRQATLYAYLAGIIDGEGTIRIARFETKARYSIGTPCYAAHISVGMSERKVMEKLQEAFGKTISVRKECVPNRKLMYRWGTSGNKSVPLILEKIYPFLIAKKEQARLVLKYCKEVKTTGFRRDKGLPKKELLRREELYWKVKKLNAVGAAATTNQEDSREAEVIV